jgi:hypothetical protein
MTRDFLVNYFAGIFTAISIWLTVHVLAPRYRAWKSRAPTIEGTWRFFDSEAPDEPEAGTAVFDQLGESVSVRATRTRTRRGQAKIRVFEYKGLVRNGQVQLAFEEQKTNGFSAGNLVLKLSSDLKTLSGYTVYFDHDAGRVVAFLIVFRRS